MTIVHLILGGLVVTAVWLVLVTASPTRSCVRCKGQRVCRNRLTGRLGGCPRCKATGRHYRLGATLVHRARWALRRAVADEIERRRQRKETGQ